MNPERWQQISVLFHMAMEREPRERAVLLAQADPDVRREVESLLAQRSGGGLLDPPVLNLPETTPLAAGTELGLFRIESSLATTNWLAAP